ncbi:MAG: alpha/beta hydrolase [Chloroflexi bacterium]|nr:alpha/beta hydrolase [Chloroflexota bacterium]
MLQQKILALCLVFFAIACQRADVNAPAPTIAPNIAPTNTLATPTPRANAQLTPDSRNAGKVERDVTYCTMDNVALKMDAYYPRVLNNAPAVVYVHGGGWTQGDKSSGEGARDISELQTRGYAVFSINYRLAPQYKFPAQIQDVKCAIRSLRANAAQYGLDPNRVGVWGGSAGGHLVALLGTSDARAGFDVGEYAEQSSRVQAVVDYFGPADFTNGYIGSNPVTMQRVFGANLSNASELAARYSPITYVSQDDPPFSILHGDKDEVVPLSQSQILNDKLKSAGVESSLVVVKNAGHGFAPSGGAINPSRAEITRLMADFFDKQLKSK